MGVLIGRDVATNNARPLPHSRRRGRLSTATRATIWDPEIRSQVRKDGGAEDPKTHMADKAFPGVRCLRIDPKRSAAMINYHGSGFSRMLKSGCTEANGDRDLVEGRSKSVHKVVSNGKRSPAR